MNKYITALLVVLASTGVEAQTYQSALRIALGDATIEDLCHKQTFKGIEQDILSILDAIKQIKEEEEIEPAQSQIAFISELSDKYTPVFTLYSNHTQQLSSFLPNPSLRSGIKIRAPSYTF
ncbi:MAG: hypothetical protein HXO50_03370 [Prevotella sp.]|jgi:hypothetical protein|uniref:hypothetical protein n=1 Tax=uncultured Prevotella sp. TaxID=159272 RepID=UPI001CB558EA|nr:hypothetical protein [uncultured Prevotella sp.]MBF1644673.1 hypothetical protein [Prevotella sp.]